MNMKTQKHNPDYKLISTKIDRGNKIVELVYGETNTGENKGLEAYYTHKGEIGHYISFRWDMNNVPKVYKDVCDTLRNMRGLCLDGHKLEID